MKRITKAMRSGLNFAARSALLSAIVVPSIANAGVVRVFGEELAGFSKSSINSFYNSYGGNTSSILSGQLDSNNLTGVDLLWATQPSDAYTSAELATMANYLAGGGRIAFMGEHGTFGPAQNTRINAALLFLGATIQINNSTVDSSFRSASVADGQIKANPLTAGVNTYQYAAFAPLVTSGTAQTLMVGEENSSDIMMSYQNIGAGSIFLITDQNVWDNAATLWGDFDNEVMFQNLVQASTTGAVPEPATWAMMLSGFGMIGFGARRRQSVKTTVRIA